MDNGVIKLRLRSGFPGMKILQFAFDGEKDNPYLPENMEENSVVYTGTHDNDTSLGFINKMSEEEFKTFKTRLRAALAKEGIQFPFVTPEETVTALNVCALASKARMAIIPVQDMLALGTEARMNIPSIPDGNWRFRLEKTPSRISSAIMRKAIDKFKR